MRNRTVRACLVMLTGVVVVVGCGGESSKPAAGGGGGGSGGEAAAGKVPDPCALVTKQEVAAAVGDPVSSTEKFPKGYSNECLFRTANGFTSMRTLVFNDRTSLAQFDAYVRGRQKDAGASAANPVPGLGDAARYLVGESGTEPELHVLKGGVYFVLGGFTSMYGPDGQPAWEGTAPPPTIRHLAMKALTRLPQA